MQTFKQIIESGQDTGAFKCFEWRTIDNPYFPKQEIDRLKNTLDKRTFDSMFTINWDTMPKAAVYDDWCSDNEIRNYRYNPKLSTYICIDWGWAHPMSVGFYQHDPLTDHVYKFDEIVESKLKLENLYLEILKRDWIQTREELDKNAQTYRFITNVAGWGCDIAGDQEREQTAKSNCTYMKENFGINFKRRRSRVLKGINVVRSYIKNANGYVRFFVCKDGCPKTIGGIKRYAFPEKDGSVQNENPIKKDDDEVDETRYFFWNFMDPELKKQTFNRSKIF